MIFNLNKTSEQKVYESHFGYFISTSYCYVLNKWLEQISERINFKLNNALSIFVCMIQHSIKWKNCYGNNQLVQLTWS